MYFFDGKFAYVRFFLYFCSEIGNNTKRNGKDAKNTAKMQKILLTILTCLLSIGAFTEETYLFAEKDTARLYLDIHRPTAGSDTLIDGKKKPAILYVFGGGFVMGARNEAYAQKWYRMLNDAGYCVVAIDYRLGMKGYKMGKGLIGAAKALDRFMLSQQMGVEDVCSAVSYLAEHPELGIDMQNLVIAGSSAGAIISLATTHAIANGQAVGLPEGFRFKGVMSFAGGIISRKGAPSFATDPGPILLLHGTLDKAVAYKQFGDGRRGIWGSNPIAKMMQKKGLSYRIYRFEERGHDVAAYMCHLLALELDFLEKNVIQAVPCRIDALVNDPSLPVTKMLQSLSVEEIYR